MSQMKSEESSHPLHFNKGNPLLVVDDNSMNRIILSRYIARLSYQAMVAENGRQALEKLQGGLFDLVLLDVEQKSYAAGSKTTCNRHFEKVQAEIQVPLHV